MGWDGAGGYTRNFNFSSDASSGIKILAARMDAELDDFASAMTIAWARNGQNVPTQNLPMGGRTFINVGAATSVNNFMRVREFIENVPIFMQDQESSADRISVSAQYFTSVSANQAPGDGTRIIVRANSNKSSAVIYLNGHSANVEFGGSRAYDAMVSGGIYEMLFSSADSTWQIVNPDEGRASIERSATVTPTNYQYARPSTNPVVNVKRFGAVGDGVADDTAAFVAALKVGDVFVPHGTYKITSRLPLTEYGLIGEGWGRSGNARSTRLVSYNQTDATLGFIYTDYDSWNGRVIPIKNLQVYASSWDGSTGSLGYGIDITASIDIDNVEVKGFAKSGVFFHNTDTDGEAPYNSFAKNLFSSFNGNHGLLIGTGANVITLIQYEGKWNGAPSFGVQPSVAGNYDGLFVSRDGDGNPGTAYHARLPESLSIMGGDCSYNSRYGWNFEQCQSGHWFTDYCEGNLQASPGQINLGNGLRECFGVFNGVEDETDGVNFGSVGTFSNLAHTNHFWVGGQDCGSGNSNTATSRRNFSLARSFVYFAHNDDQSNGARIVGGTDGVARLGKDGTGGWIMRPVAYTVATLPSAGGEGESAIIYVSDETGGAVLAFSDGTNWRRVTDRAVVS